MLRVIASLCLLPSLFLAWFFAYTAWIDDSTCGAGEGAGWCYGVALMLLVIIPLAFITAMIAVALFAVDAWRRRTKRDD